MATVQGQVSLQMLDALGVTVSAPFPVNVDDTKTIAQTIADVGSLAAAVDAVSDSQITLLTFSLINPPSGLKSAPAATAENERTGLLNFKQTGNRYKFGVDIPGIADSKITNGKINLSDADIQALVTLLTTAHTVLTYVSTGFHALTQLLDALLSFRKHRKAESRRSFEVA